MSEQLRNLSIDIFEQFIIGVGEGMKACKRFLLIRVWVRANPGAENVKRLKIEEMNFDSLESAEKWV